MQRFIIPCVLAVLLLANAGRALAQHGHSGMCADCHSMHNSQDGLPLRYDGGLTPLPLMLRADCVSCHTGLNTPANFAAISSAKESRAVSMQSISSGTPAPRVMTEIPPVYTWGDSSGIDGGVLAGGSFYWATINEAFGHNVTSIPGMLPDSRLGTTPPGGTTLTSPLQCAGLNGCHGDPSVSPVPLLSLDKAHHNNAQGVVDGATVGSSYRFLLGVQGEEDRDWEWTVSAMDHNNYTGQVRAVETTPPSSATMSGNCAKCHGDFHNSATGKSGAGEGGSSGFASPWVRHPNDYDMALTGDYAGYASYSTKAPVARTPGTMGMKSKAAAGANQRIIMCLTCHRAHGSPYYAMLRWNYRGWPGPDGQDGCQICHTSK